MPGGNIQGGGKHLQVAIFILLLLSAGGIHIAAIKINKEGKAKADEGNVLRKKLDEKMEELSKRENAGEPISPEEYEAIDREGFRIDRQYPMYYHTINRTNTLYTIAFILVILAIGLPLAKSIKSKRTTHVHDEDTRK